MNDAAKEAVAMLIEQYIDDGNAKLATRILTKLAEMGFVQVKWERCNDVVMGDVRPGWPAISKDQQWVTFLPWPPAPVVELKDSAASFSKESHIQGSELMEIVRGLLHLLDTAEGLTVTDRPTWSMDRLVVGRAQTWVQSFKAVTDKVRAEIDGL